MQKYPHTFRYADILFRCFLFFYLARPFEREFCDDDGDDLVDDPKYINCVKMNEAGLNAEVVGVIGRKVILYRESVEHKKIEL